MRITLSLLLLLGTLVSLAAQKSHPLIDPTVPEVYKVVEQMPRFYSEDCEDRNTLEARACSQKAMLMYVYGNFRYPQEAKDARVEGMAVVSFIIDADGWMYSPEIVRNPGAGTGEEALRIVEEMMDEVQWWPGIQDGKPVEVKFNLPVKFKLPNPR